MNQYSPLMPGDMYITSPGVLAGLAGGGVEFIGAFGRVLVPDDVARRARRLERYGRNRFECMAAWCDRKLESEYRAAS